MSSFSVTKIQERVWDFKEQTDTTSVDAYLICGTKRALMIDTLQNACGIYSKVRELTDLPVDVVITHGHFDHAGPAILEFNSQNSHIFLNQKDWKIVKEMVSFHYPDDLFRDLEPGTNFSLGGHTLSTIALPGHTPGSMALADKDNCLLFTGDGIGSGPFWLQFPYSSSVAQFQQCAEAFLNEVSSWKKLLILPGHRDQSPIQLGKQYLKDVIHTAKCIQEGTLRGEAKHMELLPNLPPMQFATVSYGQMLGFFITLTVLRTKVFSHSHNSIPIIKSF